MTWFYFLFWGLIGFGCIIIIILGVLTRPRHDYNPLVEPAPDAFPLHYRSPYVELSGPRLIRIPGTDKWAYGYQPTHESAEHHPPQGGSALSPLNELEPD